MYVLVDLGYLMFYRYHATLRWLEFQKTLEQELTLDYLTEVFRKHLVAQLEKLKKKHKSAKFYFCKDEKQALIWRKELYPDYKANRGVADDTIRRLQQVVLEEVAKYGNVLGAPSLEADDVAFLTFKRIRQKQLETEVFVLTSDHDYLQIVDENFKIVDASGKCITGSGNAKKDLLMKIIMGDKSDNIPPIAKGCGKKTAEALADDPNKLAEFIKQKGCAAQYALNEMLVNMEKIPKELADAFYVLNETCLKDIQ